MRADRRRGAGGDVVGDYPRRSDTPPARVLLVLVPLRGQVYSVSVSLRVYGALR
jgi:hypothetical protein